MIIRLLIILISAPYCCQEKSFLFQHTKWRTLVVLLVYVAIHGLKGSEIQRQNNLLLRFRVRISKVQGQNNLGIER